MAYKAVNTLDSMVRGINMKYRAIGMVSARLDDVGELYSRAFELAAVQPRGVAMSL